jgi:hypothetical protein
VMVHFCILAAVLSGCFGHRYERNAPGDSDVQIPPEKPDDRVAYRPWDPGDQMIRLSAGAVLGGGISLGGARESRGGYGAGLEAGFVYGVADRSFAPAPTTWPRPERSLGLNVGWLPLLEGSQPSRLYLELEGGLRIWSAALGFAWEPNSSGRGPQATAFMGPFFLRSSYLSGRGTSIQIGLVLKPSFTFLWSR